MNLTYNNIGVNTGNKDSGILTKQMIHSEWEMGMYGRLDRKGKLLLFM